jgi:hypothetical protein
LKPAKARVQKGKHARITSDAVQQRDEAPAKTKTPKVGTDAPGKPVIQVDRKPLWVFSVHAAACFDPSNGALFTFYVEDSSQIRSDPSLPSLPSSLVLLGPSDALFLCSRRLLAFNLSTQTLGAPLQLPDVTVLRPDPLDPFRFLSLAGTAISAGEIVDGELFARTIRTEAGAINFVASRTLLVTVDRSGRVRGYRRSDFSGQCIFSHTARPGATIYLDARWYYEQFSDRLARFSISGATLKPDVEVTIARVFESDSDLAFQVPGHPTLVRIGEEACFDLRREFRALRLAGGCLCVWGQPNEPPTLFRVNTDPTGWLGRWREGRDEAIAAIRSVAARAAEEHRTLAAEAAQFESNAAARLAGIRTRLVRLQREAGDLERGLAERGIASRTLCLEEYEAGREENCFRYAIGLPVEDLLAVCGQEKLQRALAGKKVTEPTLLDLAARLTTLLDTGTPDAVPLLLDVLLDFNPESPVVQVAVKKMADQLLSATVDLFQTITPVSPVYLPLRKLSHVALSFKTM